MHEKWRCKNSNIFANSKQNFKKALAYELGALGGLFDEEKHRLKIS
jgi:hypothetical protein